MGVKVKLYRLRKGAKELGERITNLRTELHEHLSYFGEYRAGAAEQMRTVNGSLRETSEIATVLKRVVIPDGTRDLSRKDGKKHKSVLERLYVIESKVPVNLPEKIVSLEEKLGTDIPDALAALHQTVKALEASDILEQAVQDLTARVASQEKEIAELRAKLEAKEGPTIMFDYAVGKDQTVRSKDMLEAAAACLPVDDARGRDLTVRSEDMLEAAAARLPVDDEPPVLAMTLYGVYADYAGPLPFWGDMAEGGQKPWHKVAERLAECHRFGRPESDEDTAVRLWATYRMACGGAVDLDDQPVDEVRARWELVVKEGYAYLDGQRKAQLYGKRKAVDAPNFDAGALFRCLVIAHGSDPYALTEAETEAWLRVLDLLAQCHDSDEIITLGAVGARLFERWRDALGPELLGSVRELESGELYRQWEIVAEAGYDYLNGLP